MKIFIIHSTGMTKEALEYAGELESEGHFTYVPLRDTEQVLTTEAEILANNRKGIEWCDETHVIWDLSSLGTMFDMGVAYGGYKPIKIISTKNHHWTKFVVKREGKYLIEQEM